MALDDGSAVRAFSTGKKVQLVIKAGERAYEIFVNGVKFASFVYRIRPELVTHFRCVNSNSYSYFFTFLTIFERFWRHFNCDFLDLISCGLTTFNPFFYKIAKLTTRSRVGTGTT